ncbi:hypothetical protein HF521_004179, partial [Silurus meridionalis]
AQYLRESVDSLKQICLTHDQQLREIGSALQDLMQSVGQSPSTSAVMEPASVMISSREPHLMPPACFSGELGHCRSFLTQCGIIFQLQPSLFPTKVAKVAYVISLLSGPALQWANMEWENETPHCLTFSAFSGELWKMFDSASPRHDAAHPSESPLPIKIRSGYPYLVISSPHIPVMLGFPWLQKHNPHWDWSTGKVLIRAVHCYTVVSQQSEQQWTEHTALRGSSAQCGGAGDAVSDPD